MPIDSGSMMRLNALCPGSSDRATFLRHAAFSHHVASPLARRNFYVSSIPSDLSDQVLDHGSPNCIARRALLSIGITSVLASSQLVAPPTSRAGLAQFPAKELRNRYFLVRAGQSVAEADDYILTNPVWKTSQRSGLSRLGREQVVRGAFPELERLGAGEQSCWIWPSISQDSYQSAELLAYALGLTRNRIVPEYSFLDRRGLGALEGFPVQEAQAQVRKGDLADATWRPVHGTDGTPNESVADVLVRVRQVISITETQYSGDDVLFVAPDSDTLSILQAAVLGVDLRQHGLFAFRPGEARLLQLSGEAFSTAPGTYSCVDPPVCTGLAPTMASTLIS